MAATHHARALVKLNRPSEALPRFRRAIKVLEDTPNDLVVMLATAGAGQILAERGQAGDEAEARAYLAKAHALYTTLSTPARRHRR